MTSRIRPNVPTDGTLVPNGRVALCDDATGPIAQQRVEHERDIWVQQRQTELERVFATHDTLVREAFHLEKFVTLLSYDPKVARQDNSDVFRQFQARYDLVDHSAQAGSSRQTRRAHTERLQALKGLPTPSTPSTEPSRRVRGRKAAADEDGSSPFWSVLAESKSKGKLGEPRDHNQADGTSVRSSQKAKGKAKASAVDDEGTQTPSARQRMRKRVDEDAVSPDIQRARKRRRVEHSLSSVTLGASQPDPGEHPPESISAVLHKRRNYRRSLPETASAPPTTVIPSASPIRRVKLIVRLPDPPYTNPRQKPPPPRHGSSLESLMSSYTTLDDREVDETTAQLLARKEASFLIRVDRLRRQGRFFPGDVRGEGLLHAVSQNLSVGGVSQDPWAHVVEAVKTRSMAHATNGRSIASQIASRIRAYWESRAVKEDKVKLQEEKRLRALAKATVKLVVAEWKKAVHHIREEERSRREEEERRRGHEHLDAILDQSGQILEAQQLDLSKGASRSRSRSSSVSATLRQWASPSLESDATATDEDSGGDEDEEGTSKSEPDDNIPGVDSSFLLGNSIEATKLLETPRSSSREHSIGDNISTPYSTEDASQMDIDDEDMVVSETNDHNSSDTVIVQTHLPPDLENAETGKLVKTSSPVQVSCQAALLDIPPSTDDIVHLNSCLHALDDEDHIVQSPPVNNVSTAPASISVSSVVDAPSRASPPRTLDQVNADDQPSACPVEGPENLTHEPETADDDEANVDSDIEEGTTIPSYLKPYAVAPVEWDPQSKVRLPFLLRGTLRPYQYAGLEWLATLHMNNLNGILADEMGLGKTIQTIALLAHLACDRGIWGPHLIIAPTSVLLNWEMEFKKFLPGFKVLSYHGNTKRRKELRQGWNNKYHFNVCVTSYTLASRDAHVFKRKPWYYMILDEAHMIKNFKSQRWNILLMFRSFRRLLLTGTPLQNNLTELWALLQFLMSGTNFANLKEFGEWFSNPLEKAIEMGTIDDDTQQRVAKLHTVLRPYLLRRLKRDVEKELPQKYEHLMMCPLSKRQRLLYDEFMARAETRHDLQSGAYQKIANILMQLRKVVNHPDLFEVRPIVTSFAMQRSAIADFEIKELLIRRRFLKTDEDCLNLDFLGLQFMQHINTSFFAAHSIHSLNATSRLPMITELPGEPPPHDTRTITGYKQYRAWQLRAAAIAKWAHIGYINTLRCEKNVVYSEEALRSVQRLYQPLQPLSNLKRQPWDMVVAPRAAIKTFTERAEEMKDIIDRFIFATPAVVALDLPRIALAGCKAALQETQNNLDFDAVLHRAAVKLQIAFPDPSLLQYDCGKLQELARLLRERKAGGHRILIFTQMTRILDILEIFLNFHGYLYLRLDGATKIEERQYITERFNSDSRIFCFISSSRSGGVGINLTGADTVIFYDSDFNPQMDRQCEDRAHRIGQIRDVHIYRFISRHTVEEALLRKANQKRSLDDIVIQKGEFDWRSLFSDEAALTKALGEFEDTEDAHAAAVAASEEVALVGADEADFSWEGGTDSSKPPESVPVSGDAEETPHDGTILEAEDARVEDDEDEEEGGATVDYMLAFVRSDMEFFGDWRI